MCSMVAMVLPVADTATLVPQNRHFPTQSPLGWHVKVLSVCTTDSTRLARLTSGGRARLVARRLGMARRRARMR